MSLSIGSSSSEDDFTPDQPQITAEEVNDPSITSWTIITENPTETDCSAQQQQQRQMMNKMLALYHGESKQQKFQCQKKKMTIDEEMKQQKLMAQQILLLQEKVAKMEQEKEQQQKINEKYASEQFTKLQNDQQQKIVGETIELEKRQQQKMIANCWDANFCHNDLEINGNECLTVHHIGDAVYGHRSVYAKHPIFLLKNDENDSANSFYFEISIKKMKNRATVGFIAQRQVPLDEPIHAIKGTYAYFSEGYLWKSSSYTLGTAKRCEYGAGDTVGCGIDLATRKIFFTKNGIRLDSADLRLYFSIPSDVGQLFPFVSLCDSDDKIETNFGPNFIIFALENGQQIAQIDGPIAQIALKNPVSSTIKGATMALKGHNQSDHCTTEAIICIPTNQSLIRNT
ncbi:hypothetical protein niasHT_004523 [Heterodera trifolii]|uniref:B30.2/SPRY domain-containing protein n=1 Tax=Heterodera trifolii TaxID=157864 RepID=A0ABD2M065_9BILA